jgi:hypothetical protein
LARRLRKLEAKAMTLKGPSAAALRQRARLVAAQLEAAKAAVLQRELRP